MNKIIVCCVIVGLLAAVIFFSLHVKKTPKGWNQYSMVEKVEILLTVMQGDSHGTLDATEIDNLRHATLEPLIPVNDSVIQGRILWSKPIVVSWQKTTIIGNSSAVEEPISPELLAVVMAQICSEKDQHGRINRRAWKINSIFFPVK